LNASQKAWEAECLSCLWDCPGAEKPKIPYGASGRPLFGKTEERINDLMGVPSEQRAAMAAELELMTVEECHATCGLHRARVGIIPGPGRVILDGDKCFYPDDEERRAHAAKASQKKYLQVKASVEAELAQIAEAKAAGQPEPPKMWTHLRGGLKMSDGTKIKGYILTEALNLMKKFDAPTELSYSGMGFHIYLHYPGYVHNGQKNFMWHGLKIEVFAWPGDGGYIAQTGAWIGGTEAGDWMLDSTAKMEKFFSEATSTATKTLDPLPEATRALPETFDWQAEYPGGDEALKAGLHASQMRYGNWHETMKKGMKRLLRDEPEAYLDTDYNGDRSAADFDLCQKADMAAKGDLRVAQEIVLKSKLARPKWAEGRNQPGHERNYIQMTLEKAHEANAQRRIEKLMVVQNTVEGVRDIDPLSNPALYLGRGDAGYSRYFADCVEPVLRYSVPHAAWMLYDGGIFAEDDTKTAERMMLDCIQQAMIHILKMEDGNLKDIYLSECERYVNSYTKRQAALNDAKSEEKLAVGENFFDQNPHLFVFTNGTLDLSTMEFRAWSREDYATWKLSFPYDPEAVCPRWEQFITEFSRDRDGVPHEDVAKVIQALASYTLRGEPVEDKSVFEYGPGTRNSKSTFNNALSDTLGPHLVDATPPSTFTKKSFQKGDGPNPNLADLKGKRFCFMGETAADDVLDTATLKAFSGRDTIKARQNYARRNDNFQTTGVLWANINHLPTTSDASIFDSDRIIVIPFEYHLTEEERDTTLAAQFRTEEAKSAIFNWLLAGMDMYKPGCFKFSLLPERVQAATLAYRHKNLKHEAFVKACVTITRNDKDRAAQYLVYDQYVRWCASNGYKSENSLKFKENFLAALASFPGGAEVENRKLKTGLYYFGMLCNNFAPNEPEAEPVPY